MPVIAAGIMAGSAALGAGASYLGSKKASEAQAAAQANAIAYQQEQIKKAVAELEAVGIPSIDAQKIVLQYPELVGLETFEALPESALSQTYADSGLGAKQREALAMLSERAETGLTAEEAAQRQELMGQLQQAQQARDASILQNMAESGAEPSSGQALAMRLAGSQAATTRAAQEARDLAVQRDRRALEAIAQMGDMAGSMSAADFAQKQTRAMSIDDFNKANAAQKAAVAQRNLALQQQAADAKTAIANQQEQYNKALIQQDYQNRLAKAQSIANAQTGGGVGNMMMSAANTAGSNYAALGQLGAGLGAAGVQAASLYGSKTTPTTTTSSGLTPEEQEALNKTQTSAYATRTTA